MQLEFAPLDCKNLHSPVGVYDQVLSKPQAELVSHACEEYLKELKALQQRILLEYQPRFDQYPAWNGEDDDSGFLDFTWEYDDLWYS